MSSVALPCLRVCAVTKARRSVIKVSVQSVLPSSAAGPQACSHRSTKASERTDAFSVRNLSWLSARLGHADGKRAAPAGAAAEDGGSLSSQDGIEDGDVAVRLLSPAAEVPVDEDFEADFAALMEAHQASTCHPAACFVNHARKFCQWMHLKQFLMKLHTGDHSVSPHWNAFTHHGFVAGQGSCSAAAATCAVAYGGSSTAACPAETRASAADGIQGMTCNIKTLS